MPRWACGGADLDRLAANPCVIRGAGSAKRVHKIRPVSLDEIEVIAIEMPEQYRAMVLLAAWCALWFGELTELRRRDVILGDDEGVVRIERAVVHVEDGFQVRTPKSDAGIRDVAIPPHLLPAIKAHLSKFAGEGKDSLLFPAPRVDTWPRRRFAAGSTRRATRRSAPTCVGTTYATAVPCSPQRRAQL